MNYTFKRHWLDNLVATIIIVLLNQLIIQVSADKNSDLENERKNFKTKLNNLNDDIDDLLTKLDEEIFQNVNKARLSTLKNAVVPRISIDSNTTDYFKLLLKLESEVNQFNLQLKQDNTDSFELDNYYESIKKDIQVLQNNESVEKEILSTRVNSIVNFFTEITVDYHGLTSVRKMREVVKENQIAFDFMNALNARQYGKAYLNCSTFQNFTRCLQAIRQFYRHYNDVDKILYFGLITNDINIRYQIYNALYEEMMLLKQYEICDVYKIKTNVIKTLSDLKNSQSSDIGLMTRFNNTLHVHLLRLIRTLANKEFNTDTYIIMKTNRAAVIMNKSDKEILAIASFNGQVLDDKHYCEFVVL